MRRWRDRGRGLLGVPCLFTTAVVLGHLSRGFLLPSGPGGVLPDGQLRDAYFGCVSDGSISAKRGAISKNRSRLGFIFKRYILVLVSPYLPKKSPSL